MDAGEKAATVRLQLEGGKKSVKGERGKGSAAAAAARWQRREEAAAAWCAADSDVQRVERQPRPKGWDPVRYRGVFVFRQG